ncbi:IclR family transcriptional regulator [Alcaligenaceae bacterium]|nr:IclR family transcriptional regulator [Alcaligenaceae bacterium]
MDEQTAPAPNDRQIVIALSRGLALLDCFRVNHPLLTNSQLARFSKLPRSTVSRLTHTLVKQGYLEYDAQHSAYRLGAKVLSLSYSMLGGMALRPLVLPYMQRLADHSNSLVALATCEDYSMLIIESITSHNTLAQPLEVGAHVALDTSAMGRAYLASCSSAERNNILHHLATNRKRKPAELDQLAAKAIHDYRTHGYCTSIHDWRNGVTGVAVPLYLKNFGRRLVLTCGGSIKQLTTDHITNTIAPLLIKTAHEIEKLSSS